MRQRSLEGELYDIGSVFIDTLLVKHFARGKWRTRCLQRHAQTAKLPEAHHPLEVSAR